MALMGDSLRIGTSGLMAYQKAMAISNNNIVNSGSEDYTRQEASTSNVILSSAGIMGSARVMQGTDVFSVKRASSNELLKSLQTSLNEDAKYNAYVDSATNLDEMFSNKISNISDTLDSFYEAVQTLSTSPSDVALRGVVYDSASSISKMFNTISTGIEGINSDINEKITGKVKEINNLTGELSKVNVSLKKGNYDMNNNPPNDLLDKRDNILNKLSKLISTQKVYNKSNGSVDLFVANGQPLVFGSSKYNLSTHPSKVEPDKTNIFIEHSSGVNIDITNMVNGGEIGGVIDFRNGLLSKTSENIDRIAISVAAEFNEIQNTGFDGNGKIGKDMFSLTPTSIVYPSTNIGNAEFTFKINDVPNLKGSIYEISYDGNNYSVKDRKTNEVVASSPSFPISIDGGEIDKTSGTMTVTDKAYINPVAISAKSINLALSSPYDIATASVLYGEKDDNNLGSGKITDVYASDNPVDLDNLKEDISIEFTSLTDYKIFIASGPNAGANVGNGTYTQGEKISFGGRDFVISGTPEPSDKFLIKLNTDNYAGDNTNLKRLADTQSKGFLDNGLTSLQQEYSTFISGLGNDIALAKSRKEASASILKSINSRVDQLTGVNLDEEAAKMVKYQQAYQASAKIIKVASQIFDELLNMVGR